MKQYILFHFKIKCLLLQLAQHTRTFKPEDDVTPAVLYRYSFFYYNKKYTWTWYCWTTCHRIRTYIHDRDRGIL